MECTTVYILGVLTGVLLGILGKRLLNHQLGAIGGSEKNQSLYGLDHGKLNFGLPPQSMWMNMGFWKGTEDFPAACQALLKEVLKAAKILHNEDAGENETIDGSISIVDLGFGCGDQCLYFKNVLENQKFSATTDGWRKILKNYVGITLEVHQFRIALERLGRSNDAPFMIYCADAGRPQSWSPDLRHDVVKACQMREKDISSEGQENVNRCHQNWILGLDTLYHFQPSRWPAIEHASQQLGASLMVYDLCISSDISVWMRIALRLMASFGESPYANWTTIDGYRERLVAAGYARDNIEIHDISAHVFRPLAIFLRRRETSLQRYGLSIGRYRYAGAMFDWWARTGVIRGCIVIARK